MDYSIIFRKFIRVEKNGKEKFLISIRTIITKNNSNNISAITVKNEIIEKINLDLVLEPFY